MTKLESITDANKAVIQRVDEIIDIMARLKTRWSSKSETRKWAAALGQTVVDYRTRSNG